MTEDDIVKNQIRLVEERRQYVLTKSERELGKFISQCDCKLKRNDDDIKLILHDLNEYIYCSASPTDDKWLY